MSRGERPSPCELLYTTMPGVSVGALANWISFFTRHDVSRNAFLMCCFLTSSKSTSVA